MPNFLHQSLLGALLALSLLTACESRRPATDTTAPPATVPPAAPDSAGRQPARVPFPKPDQVGSTYHRYVGTVGAAPVVLELSGTDSVGGSYYYQRRGGLLLLAGARAADGALTLRETDPETGRPSGRWQTRQPLGPVLSGTWKSADGRRQLPFELREDYQDAVRYTIDTHDQQSEPEDCGLGDGSAQPTSLQWDAVRLEPPKPASAAQVQRRLDQESAALIACVEVEETARVTYNADFLLSIEWFRHEFAAGAAHPVGYYRYLTFDLRTGRPLALKELLRPDFELPLRRLLSEHLRTDPIYADFYQGEIEGDSTQTRWPLGPDGRPLAPLPRPGYYLTPTGLAFQYDMYEIAPYVMGPQLVGLSYQELKPLVRPGSPLARLLERRGL